jgi:hypothetical protein
MGSALPVLSRLEAEQGIPLLHRWREYLTSHTFSRLLLYVTGRSNYPETGVLTLLQALLECGLREWKNCKENNFHILQVCEGPCAVVLSSGPGRGRQTAGHSRGGLRQHTGKSADPEEVAHANTQAC